MKAIAFLPAAVAAVLALNISVASSQEVCVKEFTACMNACGTKPSKSMQDSCFSSCESKNDMCSERVFGKRQYTPAAVAGSPAQAKDAMAQKEVPQARDEQPAAEQEPAAEEKPAPAEPKKVPPQRVPVRR
jgi:ribosomal protein L12E/L44/L45/RPP1/RPP2